MERTGAVTLVGAGCGRDLITVKGLCALQQADVVVYDDLIDKNLLLETRPECERIYVGKRMGKHSHGQEEIHRLLALKAGAGKRVVRLKGGDSFVFGRGGEEILYLQKKGIAYEVIPGVTSAVAVPGHGGIPVTHRGMAHSVTIVTGHSASGEEENYKALAALDGTLVFLMGLGRIGEITQALMDAGKGPDTPAAILSKGYNADEKRIDGTLSDIAGKAAQARTPAVLVVGEVAALKLAQTLRRELDGVSVTVTGTEAFVKKAVGLFGGLGAQAMGLPCLRVVPEPENIPASLTGFDWLVFTSVNGVEIFFRDLFRKKADLRSLAPFRFACIGPGTAAKLSEYGIYADFQPGLFTAGNLGEGLASRLLPGERVLILRAGEGSGALTAELEKAEGTGGISFEDVAIYHTEAIRERIGGALVETDYIVFGSARGVEAFFSKGDFSDRTRPVCIGPQTAKAFEKVKQGKSPSGEESCLIPRQYTVEGIAAEIIKDRVNSYRSVNICTPAEAGRWELE